MRYGLFGHHTMPPSHTLRVAGAVLVATLALTACKLDEKDVRLQPPLVRVTTVVPAAQAERAFTGALYNNHEKGMYMCVACGQPLFSSDTKFDSGTGWPSFDDPINRENIELQEDNSFFMKRTEVVCKNCGAHLGHLFNDGPRETTGMRYCINSVSLQFQPQDDNK